jgi:hypothetical protein
MFKNRKKLWAVIVSVLALSTLAVAQLEQILKVGGVVAVVNAFGKDINNGINNLTKHRDTNRVKTKVVPILSVGVNTSSAIGAAQVMGPPERVDQVVAVAQPEANLLGREVRIKALIPVSSRDVIREIKTVPGVGISGLVDIRL